MLPEVLENLEIKAGKNYLDGTLGGGGYTRAIARLADPGIVLSTDEDVLAIHHNEEIIKQKKIKNVILVNGNFQNLQTICKTEAARNLKFNGLVLDLGLSSAQLEDRSRGFSFKLLASPLDMAFAGQSAKISTQEIVNTWSKVELLKIIKEYGEESYAWRIVERIIETRKTKNIATVGDMLELLERTLPNSVLNKKGIHWATKTFQGLRIATNRELEVLEQVLNDSLNFLEKDSNIVVVSYHSLEDRIVKNFFRDAAKNCICPPESPICICQNKAKIKIITKKAVLPSNDEVKNNPRARSAKLRAAKII